MLKLHTLIAAVFALSLGACSLKQREADTATQVTIHRDSLKSFRLARAMVQAVNPGEESYLVVTVSAADIPNIDIGDDSGCYKFGQRNSFVFRDDLPGDIVVDFKVPVGRNRKVTVYGLLFPSVPPSGQRLPFNGEAVDSYVESNRDVEAIGMPVVLAEGIIENLQSDMTMELWPLPVPHWPNCLNASGQIPIENADIRLTNYGPWMGRDASGVDRPLRIWKSEGSDYFYLHSFGKIFNKSLTDPVSFQDQVLETNLETLVPQVFSGRLLPQSDFNFDFYRAIPTMSLPTPTPTPTSVTQTIHYKFGADSTHRSIKRTIPLDIASNPPVQIGKPQPVQDTANLFSVEVSATRAAHLAPLSDHAVSSVGELQGSGSAKLKIVPGPDSFLVTTFTDRIGSPQGIAVDESGNVFAVDYTSKMITRFAPNTVIQSSFGKDTSGNAFSDPNGIAVKNGFLYVADTDGVYKIPLNGGAPQLISVGAQPMAVALDGSGQYLYVTVVPYDSHQAKVLKLNASGSPVLDSNNQAVMFEGSAAGVGGLAASDFQGITVNDQGQVLVADAGKASIYVLDSKLGFLESINVNIAAQGVVTDRTGALYVAVTDGHIVQKFERDQYGWNPTQNLGQPLVAGYTNGFGAFLNFDTPSAIAIDGAGNLYVAEDAAVGRIRKLTRSCPMENLQLNSEPILLPPGSSCMAYYAVFEKGKLGTTDHATLELHVADPGNAPRDLQEVLTDNVAYGMLDTISNYFTTAPSSPLVYNSTLQAGDLLVSAIKVIPGDFLSSGSGRMVVSARLDSDVSSSVSFGDPLIYDSSRAAIVVPRRVGSAPIKKADVVVADNFAGTLTYKMQHLDFLPVDPAAIQYRLDFKWTEVVNGGVIHSEVVSGGEFHYTLNTTYDLTLKAYIDGHELNGSLYSRNVMVVDEAGANRFLTVSELSMEFLSDRPNKYFNTGTTQYDTSIFIDVNEVKIPTFEGNLIVNTHPIHWSLTH